jgi:hypothetical protein
MWFAIVLQCMHPLGVLQTCLEQCMVRTHIHATRLPQQNWERTICQDLFHKPFDHVNRNGKACMVNPYETRRSLPHLGHPRRDIACFQSASNLSGVLYSRHVVLSWRSVPASCSVYMHAWLPHTPAYPTEWWSGSPTPEKEPLWLGSRMAEFTPMSLPDEFRSTPPEFPGLIAASVCMTPLILGPYELA